MKPLGKNLLAERSSLPRWSIFPLGLLLILALGTADFSAPGRMTFTLLYLVVCILAGWAAGAATAVALAGAAGLVLGWVEWESTRADPEPLVLAWNTFCRISIFAGVGWLSAEATRLTRHLHQIVHERTELLEAESDQHKQSLAALRDAEERYRSLVSNIPAVVWVTDANGRSAFVSDKITDITGFKPHEIYADSGNMWHSRVHPDDFPHAQAQYELLFEKGTFDVEYRFQRKDGRWIWLNDRSSSVFTKNGRTYAYGVCLDITERKEAQAALQQSEQQNRDLLANVFDGFLLFDNEPRVCEVNDAYCEMTGFTREELLGRHASEIDTGSSLQEINHRKDRLQAVGKLRFETRHRTKSGAQIDIEANLAAPASANGRVFCFVRDITARNRADASLRRNETRYRSLAESSPDFIFILENQLHVTYANAALAKAMGKTQAALMGHPQAEVFPPDVAAHHIRMEQEVRATGRTVSAEIFTPTPSGPRWFETRFIPLGGESASADYLMGIARDITEQKRHEFTLQIQRDVAARLSLTSNLETGLLSLLEIAATIEGIDSGGVYLLDQESGSLQLRVHRGLGADFIEAVKAYPPESPQGQLVAAGQAVYLDHSMLAQGILPLPAREGLRSLAAIPLRHENLVLGSLNLASHQLDSIPFESRSQLELLGAQAAGAIARIRAEQALKASETRIRALITGAPVVLFAVDKSGTVVVHDGQALKSIGWQPGQIVGMNVFEVFKHNPGVLTCVHRALQGEEFSAIEHIDGATFETWYSPSRDATGAVSGYIGVATNITERHRLEREILEISDREQARIGQEIHDGLCQQLVSLAFDANTLVGQLGHKHRPESAAAQRLAKYLDQSITETRRLARGLFPIRIAGDGLGPALEELLHNTGERFGLTCRFNVLPLYIPDSTVATNLYRIAQEAVNNVVKHSQARNVCLELKETDTHIELRVEDDGIGMPSSENDPPSGMGLHIMDYRARILGGSLQVLPGPVGGTIISCLVPRTVPG
jgi:PAS domain S-box-containing protein